MHLNEQISVNEVSLGKLLLTGMKIISKAENTQLCFATGNVEFTIAITDLGSRPVCVHPPCKKVGINYFYLEHKQIAAPIYLALYF